MNVRSKARKSQRAEATQKPTRSLDDQVRSELLSFAAPLQSSFDQSERLKNELVSTVSHELRTPLTSIRGALGLLAGGAVGKLPPKALDLVAIAMTNTDRLIRLITDLLDLDKLEANELELRAAALSCDEVVGLTVDGIQTMAEQHQMVLHTEVPSGLTVVGDSDRLVQVLTNLVSNAIKFSPTASIIDILVAPSPSREHIRFSVHNPGDPIPAADLPRLFNRFQQLDGSDARRRGGSGLGLAISKAIVEHHSGQMGVESSKDTGTTFWFEVPRSQTHPIP